MLHSLVVAFSTFSPPPPPAPKQSMPSVYTLPKAPSEDVREEVEVRQRRTKLSCPMQDMGDLSLWSILRKNIGGSTAFWLSYEVLKCICTTGKDLSKISMPVTLNEPLSALQRLCEELEYSELLDEAASHDNIYDRMVSSKYSNTEVGVVCNHYIIMISFR